MAQKHAEGWVRPDGEQVKLKKFNRYPLVIHPHHEDIFDGLTKIPGVVPSPERLSHNSNFVGFPKRQHTGRDPIAYGLDFGFDSTTALELFLDLLLGVTDGKRTGMGVFDAQAQVFLDGFMAPDNPQFVYWLPRYAQTLTRAREALSRDAPEELFETVWKSRDNAVSNAGQGVMGFDAADRLRGKLVEVIRAIAADGSPASFGAIVDQFERWRAAGDLASVPRLLVARAFAAIHAERYHTTVDATKQDRILPWFEEHTGFVAPAGNWADKASALSAHLERSGVFGDDLERRNMFPWYVFDQMRDASGKLPFRPGHTSRPASGEARGRSEPRTIEYRHNVIQERLVALLRERHGEDAVAAEHATGTGGRADALVRRPDGRYQLYEIKPAASAADAVRQALGQLLEYAYRSGGLEPAALHVVSDAPPDEVTSVFLSRLQSEFALPIDYMQVTCDREKR